MTFPFMAYEGMSDLFRGRDQATGSMDDEVDGQGGRCEPDGPEDRFRVVDIDVARDR